MSFNVSWFIDSLRFFRFSMPFYNASLKMLAFNLLLFVPFGFLVPVVIKRKKWSCKKVLIAGLMFSVAIEFLQMFAGRMSELDDVIMNSLETLFGYCFIRMYQCIGMNKFSDEIKRKEY